MRSLSCPRGSSGYYVADFVLLTAGGRDFGREIGFLPVDSLAESIAHKSGDLHRCADLSLSFLDGLGDRFGAVVDEGLFEQADFLVVGLQPGLDNLLDDVLRLALLAVFVGQHVLFPLHDGGIEPGRIECLRIGGGDMHRELFAETGQFIGLAGQFECNDDAVFAGALDHGVVHIARHHALAHRKRSRAAQRHVLADGRDRIANGGLDRHVTDLGGLDRLDIGADLERDLGDHLDQSLEMLVARHEIGLGIDLHDNSLGAGGQHADQAFGGNAAGLLRGLGQALLAQPVLRGLHVAAALGERGLAIHHARAGRLAEVLDHRCCDCRHRCKSSACPGSRGAACRPAAIRY